MQITITQTEIERAILEYMSRRINIVDGTHVEIEMKATRGAEGFSAVIDITDNPDELKELKEVEKARVRKAKEEGLEEAGRFLDRTAEAAKQANEPEARVEPDSEEEEPAEEEQTKVAKAKPAPTKAEPTKAVEEEAELPEPKKGSIFAKSPVKA